MNLTATVKLLKIFILILFLNYNLLVYLCYHRSKYQSYADHLRIQTRSALNKQPNSLTQNTLRGSRLHIIHYPMKWCSSLTIHSRLFVLYEILYSTHKTPMQATLE